MNIWKFTVHVLLKPGLENFGYYFASMWDECNCVVVWAFFGIAFLRDWNENWPFPVLWSLLSFPNLLAYWVQYQFYISFFKKFSFFKSFLLFFWISVLFICVLIFIITFLLLTLSLVCSSFPCYLICKVRLFVFFLFNVFHYNFFLKHAFLVASHVLICCVSVFVCFKIFFYFFFFDPVAFQECVV